MARTRKLTVEIAGEARGVKSAVTETDKSLTGLDAKFSKFSKSMKTALGVGAAGVAVKFGKESADAFVAAEEAQKALQDAFERFPNIADTNIDRLRSLNSELQKKTKYDDDALASGQAVVAQFGITGKQLEDITPLIADYASRTGKDIPSAAQDVGKAMLGNAKALKNIGIKYKATGDKAKDFANISELLRQQVGGFAEKEGTTAAGKVAILGNQFGELQEQVGAKLVPALIKLADIALKLIGWFTDLNPAVQGAIGVVAGLAAAVFIVVKAVKAWQAAQLALNVVLTANPIGLIVVAIAAFVAGLVLAYQKVGWFRDFVDGAFRLIKGAIETVFNWVKKNWPLLLGIITGPIGLAVVMIVKHWDTIKGAVLKVFNWIKSNWPLILAVITGPIGLAVLAISKNWDKIKAGATAVKDWIVSTFNGMVSFISGLPGRIGSFAGRMWNALKNGLREVVKWILEQLDRLLGPLDEIAGKVGGVVGKLGGVVGHIPGFASGVNNFGGGLAVVGERGPELVNLPRGSDVIPIRGSGGAPASGGQPSVVVDLRGAVVASEVELERVIRKAIQGDVRRNGSIPGTNIARAS